MMSHHKNENRYKVWLTYKQFYIGRKIIQMKFKNPKGYCALKPQVSSGNTATTETVTNQVTSSKTSTAESSVLDTAELFSDRDLEQSVDLLSATQIKLESDKDVTISKEGVYVLSGEVKNVTVVVEAPEDASLGYIYIKNGTLNITAADDAIRGNSSVQIDGGTINIKTCEEGIEVNNIKINGGKVTVNGETITEITQSQMGGKGKRK